MSSQSINEPMSLESESASRPRASESGSTSERDSNRSTCEETSSSHQSSVDSFSAEHDPLESTTRELPLNSARHSFRQVPVPIPSSSSYKKRLRSRGLRVPNHELGRSNKRLKLSDPLDSAGPSNQADCEIADNMVATNSSTVLPDNTDLETEEPFIPPIVQRRSSRLRQQTTPQATLAKIETGIKLRRKANTRMDSNSEDSDSTLRGFKAGRTSGKLSRSQHKPTQSSKKNSRARRGQKKPNPSHPSLTKSDLDDLLHAIASTKTPSWMTRPSVNFGVTASGSAKAFEWLSFYTVYIVLTLIPQLYFSDDVKRQALCQSLILVIGITNCIVSRTFSQKDGDDLKLMLQSYREHLSTHWSDVSVKPNLHFIQHVPEIAQRFGPPVYTAGCNGEEVNGALIKSGKNYHNGKFPIVLLYLSLLIQV